MNVIQEWADKNRAFYIHQCDNCGIKETEKWHEDSNGVLLCDSCYEEWVRQEQDNMSGK